MTKKEKLLKIATSEQWDWWLTLKADALMLRPGNIKDWHDEWYWKELDKICREPYNCLFCAVYKGICSECIGTDGGCIDIPYTEKIDKAIEHLEKFGVFNE
jgi:hypothetical protein